MASPIKLRGYKSGFKLVYLEDRKIHITSGELHLSFNPDSFDDVIISMESQDIDIISINPWSYCYVYIGINGIAFLSNDYPRYNINTYAYYHPTENGRCIGCFFVLDGYIAKFKQLEPYEHSYGDFSIIEFTDVSYNLFNLKFLKDRLIILPQTTRLAWNDNWVKIIPNSPFWGDSESNCNYHPKILFQLISTSYSTYNLEYRAVETVYEQQELIENTPKLIATFLQNTEEYSPNKLWNHNSPPQLKKVLLPVSEMGEGLFHAYPIVGDFLEISLIGWALPKYISDNSGHLPQKYTDIFTGLIPTKLSQNRVSISAGQCSFPNPAAFSVLSTDIIVEFSELLPSIYYYLYVSSGESTFLDTTSFILNDKPPLKWHNQYYDSILLDQKEVPINHRYLASVWVDDTGTIDQIFPVNEFLPSSHLCLYSANREVQDIIQYSFNKFPYFVANLFKPYISLFPVTKFENSSFYDYTFFGKIQTTETSSYFIWEREDPKDECVVSDGVLFRSLTTPFLRQSINLCELNKNSYVYLQNIDEKSVGLVVNFYEICEEQQIDSYFYLYAKYHTLYFQDPVLCSFTKGHPFCQTLISKDDDIYIEEFSPLTYDDPQSIGFTAEEALNLDFKCAKIITDPDYNSYVDLLHIRNAASHSFNIDVRVRPKDKVHAYFQSSLESTCSLLQLWFENVYCNSTNLMVEYIGSELEDQHIRTSNEFHLLQGRCNPMKINSVSLMDADLNISLIIDYCLSPYFPVEKYYEQEIWYDNYFSNTPSDTSSYFSDLYENWTQSHINYITKFRFATTKVCRFDPNFKEYLCQFCNKFRSSTNIEVFDAANPYVALSEFSRDQTVIREAIYKGPWASTYYDRDYTDCCWFALDRFLHTDGENDKNVIILIGDNYLPTTSTVGTDGYFLYPSPYPYHLFDLVWFANKKNITIYSIGFSENSDLDFVCRSTWGKYYWGTPNDLPKLLQQLFDDIKFMKYRINTNDTCYDGQKHDIKIQSVGKYRGITEGIFESTLWKPICTDE